MPESKSCTSIINLRYQDGSEGSASNPANFNNQDFAQLKENHLRRRKLFVDSTFPPNSRSLGALPDMASWRKRQVEWLRPAEILKRLNSNQEPNFCTKGATRFDFSQGSLGNCWFLAAIASLTFQKGLMVQVVPVDQNFKDYAGIFHFRFWRYGKWVNVVIDDLLPTIDNELVFVKSKGGNEFWVPLLEKAYAKVCGSYTDLDAGLPSEACKDFCGGVTKIYELKDAHTRGHDVELWNSLSNATGCQSMICCGTPQKNGSSDNTVEDTGIVNSHAYTVTAVTEVQWYGMTVKLVRVFNPWGRKEWNGDWSDKSDKWNGVSPADREKRVNREDGETWIELEEFCRNFDTLFICCENPNFIDGDISCQWQCMVYDGSWVAGRSAGGSWSNSTFETNPQYRLEVSIIDRDEKKDKNIYISLMQKPEQKNRQREDTHPIAVTVYKLPEGTPKGRLNSRFFNRNRPQKQIQMYTGSRELLEDHSLEPGEYLIIPSTMKPYQSGDFVLTVYTKTDAKLTPHDEHDDEHDHDHDHDHNHEDKDKDEEEGGHLILPTIPTDNGKDENTNVSSSVRSMFNRYADQRGELGFIQLRKLLNDNFPLGHWDSFGFDTCRSMIAIVDTERKGVMTLSEFSTLWNKMDEYKKLFNRSDLNRSGSLSDAELQMAVESKGIKPSDHAVQLMLWRYSGFSSTNLEKFVTLMLRLENMSNTFNNRSSDGVIHMTWDEFSEFSMYS